MRQNVRIASKQKRTKRASLSRTARTRSALGRALTDLMTERAFDSITVQDVLDRAGISRSTFYVHYDGKEDLFTSDVARFWTWIADWISNSTSDRIVPLRELLEHVADTRDFQRALRESGKHAEVFEAGRLHIAEAIERRLSASPRARHLAREHLRAIALMQASAFLSLVEWWLERDQPMTVAEADDLFHRTFWKAIES
jgi:AcrR family transcriptional regulator